MANDDDEGSSPLPLSYAQPNRRQTTEELLHDFVLHEMAAGRLQPISIRRWRLILTIALAAMFVALAMVVFG